MNLYHDTTGLIHLISSIIALIAGTYILGAMKGTRTHKKIGYLYVILMVLVNITALLIYRLFGKFAIFHWFAVISISTIILGMLPFYLSKSKTNLANHFSFMYWSVIGLYAAFVSEIFTRLPRMINPDINRNNIIFFTMLNIAIFLVIGLGAYFFIKNKNKWEQQFSRK